MLEDISICARCKFYYLFRIIVHFFRDLKFDYFFTYSVNEIGDTVDIVLFVFFPIFL